MKGREAVLLAVVGMLSVAALVTGCGSSGSDAAATSSQPLTRKQFTKQAEEICEQGAKKKDAAVSVALKKLAEKAKGPPVAGNNAELVEETVLPAYREAVEQMGQLGPPKGDEAKVEKVVREFEKALQNMETAPAQATKKNPFTSADEAAQAYGIENCRL